MKLLIDISGWVGSLFIILSYSLTLSKTIDYSRAIGYLNLTGAIMVAFNCFYYNALPSFVTNIIWCGIACLSIYKTRKHFLNSEKNKSAATGLSSPEEQT